MSFMIVKKKFKLVGMRGYGEYAQFSKDVPELAKKAVSRAKEMDLTGTEIALFEPKKDEQHKSGHYYVGVIVSEKISEVPAGMEYIEFERPYVTTRGDMSNLGELHMELLNWAKEQGQERDRDSYIVETYHPAADGMEEVEIYLPIKQ